MAFFSIVAPVRFTDDEDIIIIGLGVLLMNSKKRRRKHRRWQVHPILENRHNYGVFHTLVKVLGELEYFWVRLHQFRESFCCEVAFIWHFGRELFNRPPKSLKSWKNCQNTKTSMFFFSPEMKVNSGIGKRFVGGRIWFAPSINQGGERRPIFATAAPAAAAANRSPINTTLWRHGPFWRHKFGCN